MRLGLFKDNLHNMELKERPFEDKVSFARSCGVQGLQHFYSEEVTEEYLSSFSDAGFEHTCIHIVSRITSADDEVFDGAIKDAERLLELCARTGCKHVMIVPCIESDIDGAGDKPRAARRMAEGLRLIVGKAEPLGIDISIENFSRSQLLPFGTVEDIVQMLEWVPGLKYVFDTGNFACLDIDVLKAYETLKPYIYMFHIKDFDFTDENVGFIREDGRRFNGCDFGTGKAQLGELLARASEDLPDAWYIIEYHRSFAKCSDIRLAAEYVGSFFR